MPTDTNDIPNDAHEADANRFDPRGLIAEAFAIDGITEPDCRSIFFDWALGLDTSIDQKTAINTLLAAHAAAPDDHPMRAVLLEGLGQGPSQEGARRSGRRGGRARTEARRAEAQSLYLDPPATDETAFDASRSNASDPDGPGKKTN